MVLCVFNDLNKVPQTYALWEEFSMYHILAWMLVQVIVLFNELLSHTFSHGPVQRSHAQS